MTRWLSVVALAALLMGCGVTAPSRNPGYVNFDASGLPGVHRDTSISLGPTVLRFAARHVEDDPAAEALLRSVDGVRVQVYELREQQHRDSVVAALRESAAGLDAEWQPIVRVMDEESEVFVYLKHSDAAIEGLAILAVDDMELVFVNVMGQLDREAMASLGHAIPERHARAVSFAAID